MKFPLYEFFRPLREYFLAFSVHEYFSFNFPLREYIFFCTSPPPTPHKFSSAPCPSIINMHNIFTCLIYVNGEYPLFINVNCAMHARRLKGGGGGMKRKFPTE